MKTDHISNFRNDPFSIPLPSLAVSKSLLPQRLLAGLFTAFAILSSATQPTKATELPENVAIQGMTVIATVRAEGVQIYECKVGIDNKLSWQFREPLATLLQNGKTVGHHFAGPSWEFTDGSMVKGKMVAQASGQTPGDIPLLKLDVVERSGEGILSTVTAVQRVDTKGGVFSGACAQANTLHLEPYTASYIFLAK